MEILDADSIFYPKRLKEIKDFPKKIYVEGNMENLNTNCITVVGSRNCTEYGKKWCEIFVKELLKYDLTIVSGMALGIDTVAHISAIKGRGKTIAVLPSGLNNIYPRKNLVLYENIIKSGGTVITEYLPETKANSNRFLERNRIVSGLSIATLVIEAAHRSGTSVTAKLAFSQNRDVYCIPGNIENSKSAGTNNLIKQGAKLVTSPEDIVSNYVFLNKREEGISSDEEKESGESSSNVNFGLYENFEDEIFDSNEYFGNAFGIDKEDDEEYKSVFKLIKDKPIDLDSISRASGERAADVMQKITLLELQGRIIRLPGNRFIRRI